MAFPQTKTPLPLTVRKRQRRINSSAVPLLLPVQSPAPQCASNNARLVITEACRSRLLGRIHRPFSRKARRGSSHGRPALPCTSRQLSAAFLPGTFSRHSRIFHCHGVYSPGGLKSRDMTRLFFHLVHIMNESSSCDDCLGQLRRAWILYKKGEVTACWVSVKQFSKNDTATACQDWLRSTRLGRGSIKSHVRTVKVLGMGLFAFQERVHLWKGVTH